MTTLITTKSGQIKRVQTSKAGKKYYQSAGNLIVKF